MSAQRAHRRRRDRYPMRSAAGVARPVMVRADERPHLEPVRAAPRRLVLMVVEAAIGSPARWPATQAAVTRAPTARLPLRPAFDHCRRSSHRPHNTPRVLLGLADQGQHRVTKNLKAVVRAWTGKRARSGHPDGQRQPGWICRRVSFQVNRPRRSKTERMRLRPGSNWSLSTSSNRSVLTKRACTTRA